MTTAIVVGAGPNGLTAAAVLARAGIDVTVLERLPGIGGAAASAATLGAGTVVDLGAAAHPFGAGSPAFLDLDLASHGLEWVHAAAPLAHPLPGGRAAILHRDAQRTAAELGVDARAWLRLLAPATEHPLETIAATMGPLVRVPEHPLLLARLGARGAWPALPLASAAFRSGAARALFGGMAAHGTLPLTRPLTGALGIAFGGIGHTLGWPFARGGTQAIPDALAGAARAAGARIETGVDVDDLAALPAADLVLLDLTPRQVLRLAGDRVDPGYARRLAGWTYGPAVSKVDYLLDGPVPWDDPRVAGAGTVHLGGRIEEVHEAEAAVASGRMPPRPFVLVCQPSAADPSRARPGEHVLWAYAHVPHGWRGDARDAIEAQIERFAPGFRDRILTAHATPPAALQAWNPNLVGGSIGGGSLGGLQQLARPVLAHPYRAGQRLYVCSSATPPGGGVHGMAGWHAARATLRDLGA